MEMKCLCSSILKIYTRVLSWMKCHDATKIQSASVPHKLTHDWFFLNLRWSLIFILANQLLAFVLLGIKLL